MEAIVRNDFHLSIVQAHTGRTFVKYEWRAVPDGDAECPLLDYREVSPPKDALPILTVDIEEMTLGELRKLAKARGIKSANRMGKGKLVSELKDD